MSPHFLLRARFVFYVVSACELILFYQATKLGERAVQHADAMLVLSEGHLCIARALHAQGRLDEATKQYILAAETNPDQMQAVLAVAQMSVVKSRSLSYGGKENRALL